MVEVTCEIEGHSAINNKTGTVNAAGCDGPRSVSNRGQAKI